MPKGSQIYADDIQPSPWDDSPDSSLKSIHLWKITIGDSLHKMDRMGHILSPEEKARASRYHQQKDKTRFTIGKGMLRQILSFYMACPPAEIEFSTGINNKPYVHHHVPLEFNVSYSGNLILVGVALEDIGVDIEYVNPEFDYTLLLDNCFMEQEIRTITTSPTPRQQFFELWTRKEALLKATALGLGDYLTDFSCLDGVQTLPQNLQKEGNWLIDSFLFDRAYWISVAHKRPQSYRFINADNFFQ